MYVKWSLNYGPDWTVISTVKYKTLFLIESRNLNHAEPGRGNQSASAKTISTFARLHASSHDAGRCTKYMEHSFGFGISFYQLFWLASVGAERVRSRFFGQGCGARLWSRAFATFARFVSSFSLLSILGVGKIHVWYVGMFSMFQWWCLSPHRNSMDC